MLKRLNKPRRVGLYLLLLALLLFVLWLVLGMPRQSLESAFRRVEERQLLPKSQILLTRESPPWHNEYGKWDVYLVVGKSEVALHITEVEHKPLRWTSPRKMHVLPLDEGPCFDMIPWLMWADEEQIRWTYGAVVYTGLMGSTGELTLTVGDKTFTRPWRTDDSGLAVVTFDDLHSPENDAWFREVEYHLGQSRTTYMDMTLTYVKDEGDGRVTEAIKNY